MFSGHLGWRQLGLSHGAQCLFPQVLLQVVQAVVCLAVRILQNPKLTTNNYPCGCALTAQTSGHQRQAADLSRLPIFLCGLDFLSLCSSSSSTSALLFLMLLVLLMLLIFFVFLFLLLFLLLSTAVNVRSLERQKELEARVRVRSQPKPGRRDPTPNSDVHSENGRNV